MHYNIRKGVINVKKLFCAVLVFLVVCAPSASFAMTEEEGYQYIHDMFANHTDADLQNLLAAVTYEIQYRNQAKQDDSSTQELILNHFESNGLKIKRVMFQPLIEKDPGGLYGGKERWWITFENGEQIAAWVLDSTIEYTYGGTWYNDVPL
jgi:hypothetical protein